MALDSAAAEPVVTTVTDPTPSPIIDKAAAPAASQQAPKWEESPQFKAMLADLQKERTARSNFEKQHTAAQAERDEWKRKVEALSGLKVPSKEDADTETVRARLRELYPEIESLGEIKALKKALEEQQVRGYSDHSARMIAQLHQGIAAELGELSQRQKDRITAAYVFLNEHNPDIHARHNAGDPDLVKEFVKDYLDDLVEPIKKKITASEATRFRPVPTGKDRTLAVHGEKKIDVTNNNQVMDMLVASRKGKFGR